MPKKPLNIPKLRRRYERVSGHYIATDVQEDILDLISENERLQHELELFRLKLQRNDVPNPKTMEDLRLHEFIEELLAFIDSRLLQKGED